MKNSFILYTNYMQHLELLSMEQRGILLTALLCYQSGADLPEMDALTKMAFSFIRQDMDANNEKYNHIVERNRQNGRKGGRPQNNEIEENPKNPNGFSENPKNPNGFSENPKNPNGFSENPKKPKKADNDNDKKNKYLLIANMYNDICMSFPRLKSLSDARKKAINARLKNYSIEDFETLFQKAEASDFLKGANDRNWAATFDWLISDKNMAKVLDGNYDKRQYSRKQSTSSRAADDLQDFYKMAADWAESEDVENE